MVDLPDRPSTSNWHMTYESCPLAWSWPLGRASDVEILLNQSTELRALKKVRSCHINGNTLQTPTILSIMSTIYSFNHLIAERALKYPNLEILGIPDKDFNVSTMCCLNSVGKTHSSHEVHQVYSG